MTNTHLHSDASVDNESNLDFQCPFLPILPYPKSLVSTCKEPRRNSILRSTSTCSSYSSGRSPELCSRIVPNCLL
ncbi:hypothetical protein EVAR_32594_1 [Eumeta japonica]|uniref:Uncharacterized protein n=1 Tax=Eumeta variegata TaxID=151549 RepID=A0A4C1WJ36_EUMVA|nr:hypothetical protein EVAR_32594_1 [Eumeta japonica]